MAIYLFLLRKIHCCTNIVSVIFFLYLSISLGLLRETEGEDTQWLNTDLQNVIFLQYQIKKKPKKCVILSTQNLRQCSVSDIIQ